MRIQMYRKIWGLKQLEKMQFPCPPYVVIDIAKDTPLDVKEYVLRKIGQIGIPIVKNDRIGVTIRVSLPDDLDKLAKHGGLHVTDEKEVLKKVLEKHQQYKPDGKVIVQHTVDARCSGTVLKEIDQAIIEAIFGDAPPLLEGDVTNYEKWVFHLKPGSWKKERTYKLGNKEAVVLTQGTLQLFEKYIKTMPDYTYLEWSISKNGKLYLYEYYPLTGTL
jgi:hypothetical protein